MKKHILAVIIASTVLAGCSSSSTPNDTPAPTEGTANVIYNEGLHAAAIIGDEGTNAIIIADDDGNATVRVNGETYTVQGNDLLNSQGDVIGHVTTKDGTAIAQIGETTYTLTVIDGRLIIDSADFEPDFDGLRIGDAQFEFIGIETDGKDTYLNFAVNGMPQSAVIHISVTGEFTVTGVNSSSGFWFHGYVTDTNEYVITGFKGNDLNNHVTWSADGGFKIVDIDVGWGNPEYPLDEAKIDNIKNTVKSLSAEQRQQIKQAIKTKLQTRS